MRGVYAGTEGFQTMQTSRDNSNTFDQNNVTWQMVRQRTAEGKETDRRVTRLEDFNIDV